MAVKTARDKALADNPDLSVFAFTSDTIDIFEVGDVLSEQGWFPDRIQFNGEREEDQQCIFPFPGFLGQRYVKSASRKVVQEDIFSCLWPDNRKNVHDLVLDVPDKMY